MSGGVAPERGRFNMLERDLPSSGPVGPKSGVNMHVGVQTICLRQREFCAPKFKTLLVAVLSFWNKHLKSNHNEYVGLVYSMDKGPEPGKKI